jgi:AraC-like DNA-binding protein
LFNIFFILEEFIFHYFALVKPFNRGITKPNMNNVIKEITPLTQSDCFTVFSRVKKTFNFPLHFHEEYELNLIINASGAKRIIGDHEEVINDIELVLVGPNLSHAWFGHTCESDAITEVTLQWHKDLFDEKFLRRNQLTGIRTMLEASSRGLLFSRDATAEILPRLLQAKEKQGFSAIMELMNVLNELSMADGTRILSETAVTNDQILYHNSRRIDKVLDYMNNNFQKNITLKALSRLIGMTEVSFSRFIKQRTGNTFIDTMNEIRLGNASRMLIESNDSIADIAVKCGFNNISNFNRVFKFRKHCTPKEFRENFSGTRVFI